MSLPRWRRFLAFPLLHHVPLFLLLVSHTTSDEISNIESFKIMGERNTGTRYLQQLLQKNLPVPHLRLEVNGTKLNSMTESQKDALYGKRPAFWGWKHACAPTPAQLTSRKGETAHILFVVTAKNPCKPRVIHSRPPQYCMALPFLRRTCLFTPLLPPPMPPLLSNRVSPTDQQA